MQTPAEYIDRTESAMRKLFEGIDSYIAMLPEHPVFVTTAPDEADRQAQYEAWANENSAAIEASLQAQRDFTAESFALATLCGSVLQVAAKALECFSLNSGIPPDWSSIVKPGTKPVPFCVGRRVRNVPLGLIIYAGRNQHLHFEVANLREPNPSVFDQLASNHNYKSTTPFRDPAFDRANIHLVSFASNIIALIEWRSYDAYVRDIRALLAI